MAKSNQTKQSLVALPESKRRRILWLVVATVTLTIFIGWLALFKIIVAPSSRDEQTGQKIQELEKDLATFAEQIQGIVGQAKQAVAEPPTAAPVASEQIVARLKERLLSEQFNDWQPFENRRYGFSFRYPSDWQLNATTTDQDARFIASVEPPEPELKQTGLWLFGSTDTTIFESCAQRFAQHEACITTTTTDTLISIKEITVLNDDKKIILRLSYETAHQAAFEPIFEKLLNTFEFSEPDPRL